MLRTPTVLRASLVVLLCASYSPAQRKKDAPKQEPPPPLPENVADQSFRDAYRNLGYVRMAVVVNVHVSDSAVELGTKTRTVQRPDGSTETTSEPQPVRLAIPKEDQTNAWRINRALASRLMDCFRHRDIRMTLVSLDDMGAEQATEVRGLILRNEQEAARQIGKRANSDLILVMTLSKAVPADANGARYGANYFVADTRRNEIIDSWSWDMKPDQNNAFPAPLLGTYARHAAVRIHDKFLIYSAQAAAPGGGTLRFHTLKIVGLPSDQMSKLTVALSQSKNIKIIRSELETRDNQATAVFEVESAGDAAALAERARKAVAEALSASVTISEIHDGNVELRVTSP